MGVIDGEGRAVNFHRGTSPFSWLPDRRVVLYRTFEHSAVKINLGIVRTGPYVGVPFGVGFTDHKLNHSVLLHSAEREQIPVIAEITSGDDLAAHGAGVFTIIFSVLLGNHMCLVFPFVVENQVLWELVSIGIERVCPLIRVLTCIQQIVGLDECSRIVDDQHRVKLPHHLCRDHILFFLSGALFLFTFIWNDNSIVNSVVRTGCEQAHKGSHHKILHCFHFV